MDENNKNEDKKISFWPSSKDWIWSKWPQMARKEKIIYLSSLFFLLVLIILDGFIATKHLARNGTGLVMVIAWIIMLLSTIWMFKKREGTGNTTLIRNLFVVTLVTLFFFILGFYLGIF